MPRREHAKIKHRLDRSPQRQQRLVIGISCLPRICNCNAAELCCAVLGRLCSGRTRGSTYKLWPPLRSSPSDASTESAAALLILFFSSGVRRLSGRACSNLCSLTETRCARSIGCRADFATGGSAYAWAARIGTMAKRRCTCRTNRPPRRNRFHRPASTTSQHCQPRRNRRPIRYRLPRHRRSSIPRLCRPRMWKRRHPSMHRVADLAPPSIRQKQ